MAASSKEVRVYVTSEGRRPFDEWLDALRDKSAIARIVSRLNRVALGNLGDAKSVGGGVSELRLAFGPGYRVYFAQDGDKIVLLLCGGDKGSQDSDIRTAKTYLEDYKSRASSARQREIRRGHGKKK